MKSDENYYFNKLRDLSSIGHKNLKYQKESIVLYNFLMGLQIIVSAHAPAGITKPYKIV